MNRFPRESVTYHAAHAKFAGLVEGHPGTHADESFTVQEEHTIENGTLHARIQEMNLNRFAVFSGTIKFQSILKKHGLNRTYTKNLFTEIRSDCFEYMLLYIRELESSRSPQNRQLIERHIADSFKTQCMGKGEINNEYSVEHTHKN